MDLFKFKNSRVLLFFLLGSIIFFQGIFLIPVLDRDEARFATATKNMIETGDYLDIELEGVKRYKKPIGIYWAQAITTKVFGSEPYNQIWTYRLPSYLGILLSIFFIFFSTKKLYGNQIAKTSIFLLSCSLLLILEMHQAKSDALLFLCINICNFFVLDAIKTNNQRYSQKRILIFWVFFAIGTLIKGPIIFLFVLLPISIFCLFISSKNLKSFFKNKYGYLLYFLIVLPWFILITIKSNWLFWQESVGHDLLKKVVSSQESHGFPPGYYFISLYLFFWPGCVYFLAIIKKYFYKIKQLTIKQETFFLICIIFPPLLIFELIPTKLPHYILPIYPALSILISSYLNENIKNTSLLMKKSNLVFFLIFPTIIVLTYSYAVNEFSVLSFYYFIVIGLFLLIISVSVYFYIKKNIKYFIITIVVFQTLNYFCIVHFLNPNLEKFWIAKKISIYSESFDDYEIYHYGFNEPSLVFMLGHKSKRINPNEIKKIIKENRKSLFFISGDEGKNIFTLSEKEENFSFIDKFKGYNYSQGKYIPTYIFTSYGPYEK